MKLQEEVLLDLAARLFVINVSMGDPRKVLKINREALEDLQFSKRRILTPVLTSGTSV